MCKLDGLVSRKTTTFACGAAVGSLAAVAVVQQRLWPVSVALVVFVLWLRWVEKGRRG